MLGLKSRSPDRWLLRASAEVEELLIDHAHCEKKAAATAMNLIFAYVDQTPLVRELMGVVAEELDHFRQVLDLLEARGMRFRKLKPSRYGARLAEAVRHQEPGRAVDRLLVAGLIEARSCERFAILRDSLPDPELAAFYDRLFESEARHHATYLRLARQFDEDAAVDARLDELAALEAQLIAEGEDLTRMHS